MQKILNYAHAHKKLQQWMMLKCCIWLVKNVVTKILYAVDSANKGTHRMIKMVSLFYLTESKLFHYNLDGVSREGTNSETAAANEHSSRSLDLING